MQPSAADAGQNALFSCGSLNHNDVARNLDVVRLVVASGEDPALAKDEAASLSNAVQWFRAHTTQFLGLQRFVDYVKRVVCVLSGQHDSLPGQEPKRHHVIACNRTTCPAIDIGALQRLLHHTSQMIRAHDLSSIQPDQLELLRRTLRWWDSHVTIYEHLREMMPDLKSTLNGYKRMCEPKAPTADLKQEPLSQRLPGEGQARIGANGGSLQASKRFKSEPQPNARAALTTAAFDVVVELDSDVDASAPPLKAEPCVFGPPHNGFGAAHPGFGPRPARRPNPATVVPTPNPFSSHPLFTQSDDDADSSSAFGRVSPCVSAVNPNASCGVKRETPATDSDDDIEIIESLSGPPPPKPEPFPYDRKDIQTSWGRPPTFPPVLPPGVPPGSALYSRMAPTFPQVAPTPPPAIVYPQVLSEEELKPFNITLYAHQKKALNAMKYWKANPIHGVAGGVLALKMGLGKTLVALTHARLHYRGVPTLIVCNKSSISTWKKDIEQFHPDLKYVVLYSGHQSPFNVQRETIEACQVVITTYETIRKMPQDDVQCLKCRANNFVRSEIQGVFSKTSKPPDYNVAYCVKNRDLAGSPGSIFHSVVWEDVILDEAQKISNYRTSVHCSIVSLVGKGYFCLTGTPIVNYETDLYSLFLFMGLEMSPKSWSESFYRARKLDERVMSMDYEEAGIEMPQLHYEVITLKLSERELQLYDLCANQLKQLFIQFLKGGTEWTAPLAMFTRLRQICVCPYSITDQSKRKQSESTYKIQMPDELRQWVENPENVREASKFVKLRELLQRVFADEPGNRLCTCVCVLRTEIIFNPLCVFHFLKPLHRKNRNRKVVAEFKHFLPKGEALQFPVF
eukprot:TRINITY_DN7099_c0_g3_i1.p1 TRINITY_DN7099_c0_g3~~TRINITY_DN7099_c0_g3_i1.p1  ORF type:complete len:852 (-),score=262.83 TRINITY_DN7099_c0_g3_i1:16-2571(-)